MASSQKNFIMPSQVVRSFGRRYVGPYVYMSISTNNAWQFSDGVGSERRQSTYGIHKIAARVFRMTSQLFSTPSSQEQHAELEHLVGPRGSDGNLSFKAPILFRNCEVTDKNMFFNPVLPKVMHRILPRRLANTCNSDSSGCSVWTIVTGYTSKTLWPGCKGHKVGCQCCD